MISQLNDYYVSKGISAKNFSCQHFDDCSSGCENFTKAKEAFVSTGYEKRILPRLLFVSLDPGKAKPNAKYRTLESVRNDEEINFDLSSLDSEKSRHWYHTHVLAQFILGKFQFNLHKSQVHHYFAHTNSAKCCQNKEKKGKADKKLFRNCREFIPGEVEILQPEILITQGAEAEESILGSFPELNLTDFNILDNNLPEVRIISILEKPTIWIHTYHPNCYGDFNQQRREKFGLYSKLIFGFIKQFGIV
jgi:hypothetical protein